MFAYSAAAASTAAASSGWEAANFARVASSRPVVRRLPLWARSGASLSMRGLVCDIVRVLRFRVGRCRGSGIGGQTFYRSEEHTSELQSLMRISYAGFCLKKKKDTALNMTLSKIEKKRTQNTKNRKRKKTRYTNYYKTKK